MGFENFWIGSRVTNPAEQVPCSSMFENSDIIKLPEPWPCSDAVLQFPALSLHFSSPIHTLVGGSPKHIITI